MASSTTSIWRRRGRGHLDGRHARGPAKTPMAWWGEGDEMNFLSTTSPSPPSSARARRIISWVAGISEAANGAPAFWTLASTGRRLIVNPETHRRGAIAAYRLARRQSRYLLNAYLKQHHGTRPRQLIAEKPQNFLLGGLIGTRTLPYTTSGNYLRFETRIPQVKTPSPG